MTLISRNEERIPCGGCRVFAMPGHLRQIALRILLARRDIDTSGVRPCSRFSLKTSRIPSARLQLRDLVSRQSSMRSATTQRPSARRYAEDRMNEPSQMPATASFPLPERRMENTSCLCRLHDAQVGSAPLNTVLLVAVAAILLIGVRYIGQSWLANASSAAATLIEEGNTGPSDMPLHHPPDLTFGGTDPIDIQHSITLFPQPTTMSCWSAAATMLFGNRSIGPGDATLGPTGGLSATYDNVKAFADSHQLVLATHASKSITVADLVDLLQDHGPLWVAGYVPNGHAYVLSGIKGDGTPQGTRITIYDPAPIGDGDVRVKTVSDWLGEFPNAIVYILHR